MQKHLPVRVLDDICIYDFHKSVAFLLLNRYARLQEKHLVETLVKALKWYCIDSNTRPEKKQILVRIFRRIRKLCYLMLDSLYGPVPMRFDIGSLFLNIGDHVDDICGAGSSALSNELDGFDAFMNSVFYFDKLVLLEHERNAQRIKDYIEKDYSRDFKTRHGKTFEPHKITHLRRLLKDLQQITSQNIPIKYDTILDITIPSEYRVVVGKESWHEDLVQSLRNSCGRRKLDISVVPEAGDRDAHVAIGLQCGHTRKHFVKCFSSVIRQFTDIEWTFLDELNKSDVGFQIAVVLQKHTCIANIAGPQIITSILNEIASKDFIFKLERSIGSKAFLGRGTIRSCYAINEADKRSQNITRQHEFKCHKAALQKVSSHGPILSVLKPIRVYNLDGTHATDIDGLSIACKGSQLWLLFVEAKDQRSRSLSASRRQLKKRLKEIGIWDELYKPVIEDLYNYGAYVFAPIKYVC